MTYNQLESVTYGFYSKYVNLMVVYYFYIKNTVTGSEIYFVLKVHVAVKDPWNQDLLVMYSSGGPLEWPGYV